MEKYIPKVGEECQIHIRGGENIEKQFIDVTIVFYGRRYVVAKDKNGREHSRKIANVELKPTPKEPTEEEKLVAEACEITMYLGADCHSSDKSVVRSMIKAGYRKVESLSIDRFMKFNNNDKGDIYSWLITNNHIIAK